MQFDRNQGRTTRLRAIVVVSLLALLSASATLAGERKITRTGTNGQTSTRNITTTRTENGYLHNTTFTGTQGKTSTRSAQGQWNPDTKTWTKDINATGPNGQTASKNVSQTRTDDGYTRNATMTGPQGNTATRTTEGHWDPATKTWTKNVTTTGAEQ